ncbi:MAG TPA: polysaccharide biosynthesis/export family protein [Candidatus Angelobacter sp.]|nr:polysaccharide biosynthesis/export family protein [Candidatus Angelobacter sp.]
MVLFAVVAVFTALSRAQTSRMNPDAASTPGTNSSSSSGPSRVVSETDYVIGPDDLLVVNVWKEPELSRSVLVRPDGKITLPLLKDIKAGGSTPGQLQAKIETALSDYVSKPAVTVIVQEARSHKFNILGQVQKPGSYLLNSPLTVLDAIALAGGFREWAKQGSIYVLRESSPGIREKIAFNYKKVVQGSDPDIQLQIRDTIVVP